MFNPSCLTPLGGSRSLTMGASCREPVQPEQRRTPTAATTPTRLVIASGNRHKVADIAAMLEMVEIQVVPQPAGLEIEETGSTYAANARLKAETVARLTGCWALADDSGLEVDALGDRPGIYSARYAPSDPEKIHRLLHELGDSLYRGGRFVSAMALADPDAASYTHLTLPTNREVSVSVVVVSLTNNDRTNTTATHYIHDIPESASVP